MDSIESDGHDRSDQRSLTVNLVEHKADTDKVVVGVMRRNGKNKRETDQRSSNYFSLRTITYTLPSSFLPFNWTDWVRFRKLQSCG